MEKVWAAGVARRILSGDCRLKALRLAKKITGCIGFGTDEAGELHAGWLRLVTQPSNWPEMAAGPPIFPSHPSIRML